MGKGRRIVMQQKTDKTFEEGYQEFVLQMLARNLRDKTIRHYDDSIRQIYKIIPPETPINSIDLNLWDEFRIRMKTDEAKKDITVYTYSRDLKTILRFFMENEWMQRLDLELPKTDKTVIECYTDEELAKLLKKPNLKKCNFTEYKCWVIVNFLLSTGVRQNSLVNIQVKDVDFDTSSVIIKVTKNRKPLIIPMNKDIEKILHEYLKYRQAEDENDYLFCNEYGNKLMKSTCYQAICLYNKRRGVETTGMHRFRHTFAKKWILLGGNVVTLQKILGHSSLDITQNYINLLVSDIQNDVEEFNILRAFKNEAIKMEKK